MIESWSESMPWAKSFVTEARRIGAHPMTLYEDEPEYWDALKGGKPGSFGTVGSHEWAALAKTNAYIFFFGPNEWPRYDDLPDKAVERALAYNGEWYRRAAKAKLRGARMYLGRTSQRAADHFGVDLDTWRNELVKGSLVPPATLHRTGQQVGRRLLSGKRVSISHPNGTKLELRLKHYPIQLDDGLVDAADLKAGNNVTVIPGGVVGVSVDESFGDGTVVGNQTVNLGGGPAGDARWTFRDGRLASYAYGRGAEHFEKPYRAAPKGRDKAGYLSIGLNPDLFMSPQMEDQELGAVTVRIGGNKFNGGRNPCPFLSWVVIRGADVSVDGHSLVKEGKLA